MNNCLYYEYCKKINSNRVNFICFNPLFYLDNICNIFRTKGKDNHKVALFKPNKDMIKHAMVERKNKRKKRRKK